MKFQLLRELDAQRAAIMEDFELKKSKNQLDIYAYAKEFNIDIDEIQNQLQRGHEGSRVGGGSMMSGGPKKAKTKGGDGAGDGPDKTAKAPRVSKSGELKN